MNDDLEGSGCGLINLLSWHLPGEAEESHEELRSGKLMSWLGFELSTFQIKVWSVAFRPPYLVLYTAILESAVVFSQLNYF
jgi:hypothetical protein